MNMKDMTRKGFTLVEIMIVVAIIGVLAAIAVPNFIKSRKTAQKNACIANLKQIAAAKEQALIAGKTVDKWEDYVADAKNLTCPSGAKYTVGDEGVNPVCAEASGKHALPIATTENTAD